MQDKLIITFKVIVFTAIILIALNCTVTRFSHPELTETQLFLKCFFNIEPKGLNNGN